MYYLGLFVEVAREPIYSRSSQEGKILLVSGLSLRVQGQINSWLSRTHRYLGLENPWDPSHLLLSPPSCQFGYGFLMPGPTPSAPPLPLSLMWNNHSPRGSKIHILPLFLSLPFFLLLPLPLADTTHSLNSRIRNYWPIFAQVSIPGSYDHSYGNTGMGTMMDKKLG